MKVVISKSTRPQKRLMAKFEGRTVHFGQRGAKTFVDHKDEEVKRAWIARHRVREDWRDYDTAGSLSKHVLWSKTSISAAVKDLNASQKEYHFVYSR